VARIILYDVDGTLIRSGGAGARALERAVSTALGLREVKSDFSFGGMTDRGIFRRLLASLGVEHSEALIGEILEIYPEILREEVFAAEGTGCCPGS
jgi:phosphoglycolate phosphatase-like HAD superfamily hydrolase